MYTVGQVAKFLNVSRDTLKFYEEKELVKPKQDKENGYRQYDRFDIYDVLTINFYREIDIEIKKIQEIRKSKNIEEIELLLKEREEKILEEIVYKKRLLKKVKTLKENCAKIKDYLDKYTIKEMGPLVIKGEISEFNAYDEYEIIKKNTQNLKNAVNLSGLRRVINFDENGIKQDRFIIVKELEECDFNIEEVIYYPRCIYTVIEDGRYLNSGKNIDNKVEENLRKIAMENGYEVMGLTYVNMLIITYKEGLERVFLEIYTPIK